MKKLVAKIICVFSAAFAVLQVFIYFEWKEKHTRPGLMAMLNYKVLVFYFLLSLLIFIVSISYLLVDYIRIKKQK